MVEIVALEKDKELAIQEVGLKVEVVHMELLSPKCIITIRNKVTSSSYVGNCQASLLNLHEQLMWH